MITNYYGTDWQGSPSLQVSVSEEEIIPSGIRYANFELLNRNDCHISINGSNYIFVAANQGIRISVINSCKIVEDGISFNWIGVRL